MKYQNYRHYKLPITINPLEYGKLIIKIDNIYILSITSKAIAILTQYNDFNEIKFYREGDLIFTYKDFKTNDNEFIRILDNKKFTFKDKILKNIEIIIRLIRLLNSTTLFKHWNNNDWLKWVKEKIAFLFKHYKLELILVFLIYIIFFVIYPVDSSMMLAPIKPKFYKKTFNSIYFNIKKQIFSQELLEAYFNKFWKIVSPKLLEDSHIYILLKFQFEDGNIHTIGKLIRIDNNNYKTFIDQLVNYLEGMGDYYTQSPFIKLIFSYGFGKGVITESLTKSEVNLINFKDMKLPISIDPNDYGKIFKELSWDNKKIYFINDKLGRSIIFEQFENENIITYTRNGMEILKFKDIKFQDNKFLRKLNNKSLFFENGNKTLELLALNTPFISKIKIDKTEVNNFLTLDIETYVNNDNILIPYLISFYDGTESNYFYLTDFSNVDNMMKACFNKIFVRKYNKFNIYIHNLAKFDIIFLLKHLIKNVEVEPMIHRGRIISIKIHYGKDNQYQVQFRDSYLILLSSLEKLGRNFGVVNKKSIFPHLFVNESNLNYEGNVPTIENFFEISEIDYLNYKNSFYSLWNLKMEAIKYCQLDCISLYQVILKFNSLIFGNFNKNIHSYPTLPSLAFAIFRSNFMSEENIPKLTGNINNDIREGYTGGSTDMFIPYGKNIKCLDVNSLYPSIMIDKDMPIGKIEKFKGNIFNLESNPFGFFKVKVNCPKNILHPIVQIKHKIKNTIKTISPVGLWTMWIFSEEMYNAMKYGYTFQILEGYKFERGVIFKSYIEFLYNLRKKYDKTHPLNLIAKILLNSLYGRFGMNEINIQYEIISQKEYEKIDLENIVDSIKFDNFYLVGLKSESIEDNSNISIGVASAITAYARIFMSQFKNNPLIKLYYTDTDSIYTDSDIDVNLIDDKILGKLKLENIAEEAVFLGPKSYCLKLKNGKTITKIKGLKNTDDLTIEDFKNLLSRDSFKIQSHNKWFKNLTDGNITIKEQLYRLTQTENKRENVYQNNILVSTKPIKLK